ncbi:hypothetical protein CPB85DRAFT_1338485 [Mucidula mucida]|nr:hypothetical protein CPB85DRAFT_1338485 [Mucidula mucida]
MPALIHCLKINDFFELQPVLSVFILKHIVHNWSFERGRIIPSRLATILPVATNLIKVACHDLTLKSTGAGYHEPPSVPLRNYGAANELDYALDICTMNLQNTQAYTIHGLTKVFGWSITT